jgi:hypothetical protein
LKTALQRAYSIVFTAFKYTPEDVVRCMTLIKVLLFVTSPGISPDTFINSKTQNTLESVV